MSTPLLVLIGPMGAGKTAVGQQLALRLGVAFRDTDADIESAKGREIKDIFVTDGEPAFRELERDAVAAALVEHDGVLALGGGAVMNSDTQRRLADQRVVFLQVGLTDAAKRVGLGTSRPMLLGNVRAQMKKLLDERATIYARLATISINTDGRSVDSIVDELAAQLGSQALS